MILALWIALVPGPRQDVEPDWVRREWQARDFALAPGLHRGAIDAALSSEDWQERFAALEALGRDPVAAREALASHDVLALLVDPHPNVSAAALGVYARAGVPLPDLALRSFDKDTVLGVRRALAAALSRSELSLQGRAVLLELAEEPGWVGEQAARGLMTSGAEAWEQQLAWLSVEDRLRDERLLDGLAALRHGSVAPELVAGLRARATGAVERTLVEALALHAELDGAAVVADRARLAEGWLGFRPGEYAHETHLREFLMTTAREGDTAAGDALLARAVRLLEDEDDPTRPLAEQVFGDVLFAAQFLAECAAASLGSGDALARAAGMPEVLASELWTRALPPFPAIEAAHATRWLRPEVDEELRFGVASVLSERFRETGDTSAEALLLGLLDDPDSGLRRAAFHWLCDGPDLEPRLPALHDAWRRFDEAERVLHLRSLPRDVCPRPFRDELLALCADPSRRVGALLELLGTFEGDVRVQEQLRAWLGEALDGLEDATNLVTWRTEEARAEALVRALGSSAVDALVEALARTLASPPPLPTGGRHDPELTKACCALLGKTVEGRRQLPRFLGPEVENRARIEASIQLLVGGDPETARGAASAALVDGFVRCDAELGARVLVALGRADDRASAALLAEVLREDRSGLVVRSAAMESLGERGERDVLIESLEVIENPEVLAELALSLARRADDRVRAALPLYWHEAEARVGTPQEGPYDRHLAGEYLDAVLLAGALPVEQHSLVLAGPLASAAADLGRRLHGERTAATAFRWRAELRACETLAQGGELPMHGRWWRLDGDLLLALARLAREHGIHHQAELFYRAAGIATAGERISDGWWNRGAEIALGSLQVATELGDHAAIATWTTALWADQRLIERRIAALEDALGTFDRRAGSDPAANLDAGRFQARAWSAMAAGHFDQARALAAQAAPRVGGSRRAQESQAALVAALAGR